MRYVIGLLVSLIVFGCLGWSGFITILYSSQSASAIQITQIHSEAQTILMAGILIILGIIAILLTDRYYS